MVAKTMKRTQKNKEAKPVKKLGRSKAGKAKRDGRREKPLRVGFLLAKDNDPVVVGTEAKDMPKKYLLETENGWGGGYHADSGTAWRVKQLFPNIKVDLITPKDVSLERLKKNDVNFLVGYDLVCAQLEDPSKGMKSKAAQRAEKALKYGKCFPEWNLQNFVYNKMTYMNVCAKAGVPVLPTIYIRPNPDVTKLQRDIRARGWARFIIKPELAAWNAGFFSAYVSELADGTLLKNYFKENGNFPGYLCQEFLESKEFPGQSFSEIRTWWLDGQFSHAAETTSEDEKKGIDGIVIPPDKFLLEQAVRIGQLVMGKVLELSKFDKKCVAPVLMRFDIGFTALPVKGLKATKGTTFWLNEIENVACNWLTRYHANAKAGLNGRAYKGHKGFDVVDRVANIIGHKALELCRDGQKYQLPYMPGTFGGVRTGPYN